MTEYVWCLLYDYGDHEPDSLIGIYATKELAEQDDRHGFTSALRKVEPWPVAGGTSGD